jgi:sugar lactone lactonase YvrE
MRELAFLYLLVGLTLTAISPSQVYATAGDVYEADLGSGSIFRLTPDGGKVQIASGIAGAFGLAFNHDLDLFAASEDAGVIYKISATGTKTTFASGLNHPIGLGFDAAGNLYEADLNSSSINKFTPAGVRTTFASNIDRPLGLAVDSKGNVFVGGLFSNLITKVTPTGVKSTFASGIATPGGLAFDAADNLFVTARKGGTILKYTPAGAVSVFASALNDPYGLVFDAAGNLLEASHLGNIVSRFAPDGTRTSYATGLNLPSFLAIEPATGSTANISTRAQVQTGENVLIGGVIVTGTGSKKVILRGLGPSLTTAGVSGALANPTLELYDSAGALLAVNDNWPDSDEAAITATGIPPNNDLEAAIVTTLAPGAYTAIERGTMDTTGVGLIEVYDLSPTTPARLGNISTRTFVDTGDNVLIGGFIIGAGNGEKVLVRAIGPSLAQGGVSNVLTDPKVELYDGNGVLLDSNDNWKSSQQVAIQGTRIPPGNDLEAAILTTLPPGLFTAIVSGNNGVTGVGLVEIYNVP